MVPTIYRPLLAPPIIVSERFPINFNTFRIEADGNIQDHRIDVKTLETGGYKMEGYSSTRDGTHRFGLQQIVSKHIGSIFEIDQGLKIVCRFRGDRYG